MGSRLDGLRLGNCLHHFDDQRRRLRERNDQVGSLRPHATWRGQREFIRNSRLHFIKTQARRVQVVDTIERHTLKVHAMIKQQTKSTDLGIEDGDGHIVDVEQLIGQDAIADEFRPLRP
jgi:hypothetical protein